MNVKQLLNEIRLNMVGNEYAALRVHALDPDSEHLSALIDEPAEAPVLSEMAQWALENIADS